MASEDADSTHFLYSKCVTSQVSQVDPYPPTQTIDRRKHELHKHVENLIGPELVSQFKEGKGDQKSVEYVMWLKSKQECFAGTNHEDIQERPVDPKPTDNLLSPEPMSPPYVEDVFNNDLIDLGAMDTSSMSSENAQLETVGGNRIMPECVVGIASATIPETHSKLAKVLSPATGGEGVPTPIKEALYWPGTPAKKKKNVRRSLFDGFPVITSDAFRAVKTNEKKKKIEEEQRKEEKKQERQEMKRKKEEEAAKKKEEKNLKKKKKKPLSKKRSETESSDSSTEVSSGESAWHESESHDEAEDPKWVPVERKEGEHVIIRYDEKYFPGVIRGIEEKGAYVAAMIPAGQLWKWPQNQDLLFYNWEDVVSRIEPPRKTSKTRDLFSVSELDFQNTFL